MFLQISLKPGLIEDSWILPSTSAFNLLCMALVEVYEEKTQTHTARVGQAGHLGNKI